MNRFQLFVAAAAATLLAMPALAHDGVHVTDPYARVNGGIGATGAIFLQIENHADVDDRLLDVKSDVAEKVELHTHIATADGVMQMRHVPEGFPITALQGLSLERGGAHIMLMGLKSALKDGDVIPVTLIFEHAGEVQVEVPVDNARKPGAMGAMKMDHSAMTPAPSN
ncbi:MAG: copper chaperone PCu(A)C [Cypionkella sp.]